VGVQQEAAVRAFLAEFETDPSDPAPFVERLLGHMASEARYQSSRGTIHLSATTRSEPSCSDKRRSSVMSESRL
jgi:hypothetical protein